MTARLHDPAEPLAPLFLEGPSAPGLGHARTVTFEFQSGGDRVAGRLLLPADAARPAPLVLVGHGRGGSKDAPYLDSAVGPWVARGAAAAMIDFPLHGSRRSAKLDEHLLRARGGAAGGLEGELHAQLARQAASDLHRAVAVLGAHPAVDAGRLVYAGFSMGTILGVAFCADAPAVRAAALAIGGAGFGPGDTDPARHVGRFAPRPLLFVQAERDETIPRSRAEALHAAAGEPKQVLWFDCTHGELPGRALKAMWTFLAPHLGLAA